MVRQALQRDYTPFARAFRKHNPSLKGFFTVPIDAPFIPENLIDRLAGQDATAIAATHSGVQPTFGYWEIATLKAVLDGAAAPSLRELAEKSGAKRFLFNDEHAFMNVNTQEGLADACAIYQANITNS